MCRLTGGRVARVTGERSLRWLEHGWPSSTPAVGPGKPSRWASIAKSHAADAYVAVADSGIRVHGGIGFTWEHDMHLYLRRAKLNQARASSINSARGTTARTAPSRCNSDAGTISPEKNISRALYLPTSRVRCELAPSKPTLISVAPKVAVSAASAIEV